MISDKEFKHVAGGRDDSKRRNESCGKIGKNVEMGGEGWEPYSQKCSGGIGLVSQRPYPDSQEENTDGK